MSSDLGFKEKGLIQQGFGSYSPIELQALEWGLRFTPTACMALTVYGLVTHQVLYIFAMAAFGIGAFFVPKGHPFDVLYNVVVRHLHGGVKLPAAPLRRRLACFGGGISNVFSGLFMLKGWIFAAYVSGSILVALQLLVIISHFCVLSWGYEKILRISGKWEAPVQPYEVERLMKAGAVVVDVREATEFGFLHLTGALNIPLETLKSHIRNLKRHKVMCYCSTGNRSHLATSILRREGVDAYDLGAMTRIDYITGTEGLSKPKS